MTTRAELPAQVRAALSAGGVSLAKSGRIAGRVSDELVARAKERTGIQSDSELIEVALGHLALEDRFPATFQSMRGSVPADIDLDP